MRVLCCHTLAEFALSGWNSTAAWVTGSQSLLCCCCYCLNYV